jgi:hypothetical protein
MQRAPLVGLTQGIPLLLLPFKKVSELNSSDIPVEFEELHFYAIFANVSRKEGIPEQDQEVAHQRALRCLGSQVWAKQMSSEADSAGRQVVPATCSVILGPLSHSYT